MLTGTVIWYNPVKGIGFINPDQGGDDAFIHMKYLKETGLKQVKEGDRLTYEMREDPKTGKSAAANMTVLKAGDAALLTGGKPKIKSKAEKPAKRPEKPKSDASAFGKLGLDPEIVKALGFMGYSDPTPIQQQAIPHVLNGKDLVGLAQTGTGKTAAFTLPLIQQLLLKPEALKKRSARALILSPTRELAMQIHDALRDYGKRLPLNFTHAIGGAPIRRQMRDLEKGVDILVATPGRLEDLVAQKGLRLDETKFLVLDEADQMLDIGFLPAVKRIITQISKERQTLLFSATMSKEIHKLTEQYLTDPAQVSVTPENSTVDKIEQSLMHLTKQNKGLALERIVKANPKKRIIVFSRTKHGSDKMVKWLGTQDIKADAIHGNKSQGQRQRALDDFKKGKTYVLIATDIAARGIDIPGIELVINYDLPNVPEAYVHRIGRTARAGAEGRAIAFCAPDEHKQLWDIEKLIDGDIPIAHMDGLTEEMIPTFEKPAPRRRGGRSNPKRGSGPRMGGPKGGAKKKGGNRPPRRK
ncbi:RNA helicase [Amylibacter marinus]|uniref:RNA helicase n=1 Tax=Amylibacter marinus TaxID=1475483 RepID=A0ABQ5VT87_9RHOB|nr:DEAD/DEAH box helicase [Amylibacter marinus]GLQ34333.1 RNA helicase [Amylibacter marinus]